jgi:hypothetical protein
MNSTKTPKPTNDDVRTLRADELDAVNGGSSSFGMLSDAFNNVVNSIGDALKTAARAG